MNLSEAVILLCVHPKTSVMLNHSFTKSKIPLALSCLQLSIETAYRQVTPH